jgi:hypothetical protein
MIISEKESDSTVKKWIAGMLIGLFMFALNIFPIQATYVSASNQATFYVSPSGSDSNPGTLSAPFQTIQKARDAVRMINRNMTGDIMVYLRGGTYQLDDTIQLNELDSGTNGYRVIYRAYQTEVPVLTGGVPVTGWTLDSGGIYKATVSSVSNFRQLYVNGERAQRAQTSTLNTALGYHYDASSKIDGFIVNGSVVDIYDNASDVEINWKREWVNTRLPVAQIMDGAAGEKIILMQQPYFDWAMTMNASFTTIAITDPFYIENAKELLDEAGEWYFNQTTSTLYYWPKPGEDMNALEAYIPNDDVTTLLSIKGASMTSQANHITIQGLTFAHTTELRASTQGVAPLQASFWINEVDQTVFTTNGVMPSAAIDIEHANQIIIESNRLKHLGAAGIKMDNDVQDSQIINNTITDVSADAIIIGTWHHRHIDSSLQEALCSNILVRNNLISNVANEYWSSPAITVFFGKQIDIQHNDISNIPYTGISMGWDGWGGVMWDEFSLGSNRIAWNKISDYMKKMRDGGGIYTLNTQPDTVIEGNYITNMNNSYGGIYPDEGSGYLKIINNVVENMGSANWLYIWQSSINHIKVDHNYTNSTNMINNGTMISISNTNYYSGVRPASAQAIVSNAGITSNTYTPLPAPPQSTIGDLAFEKPCYAFYLDDSYATVHPGSDGCRAVDGYDSTYAQAFGQWKWREVVNLGSVKNINKVIVTFPQIPSADLTLYATEYKIKVSIDGTNYAMAASVTSGTGGAITTMFNPVSARYVMVEAVKPDNSGQAGTQMAISSLEVFGTEDELSQKVNDTAPSIIYNGNWNYSDSRGFGNYKDDVHYTADNGDYFEITFVGSGIELISEKYMDRGDIDIYIDDIYKETVSSYISSGSQVDQTIFSERNLVNGKHTLRGVKRTGTVMVVDAVKIYNPEFNVPVNNDRSEIHYSGSWVHSTGRGYGNYLDDVHHTNTLNDYFEFTFTGSGIDLISEKYLDRGDIDIYLDGVYIETISCYSPVSMVQQTIFSSGELANGLHTIKGVMKSGSAMVVDAFKVYDSGFNPPAASNLKLWLRADAGVIKDSNGFIGTWQDLSGNGNHAIQSHISNKPAWIDHEVNGRPVIRFDGVNDFMSIPSLTGNMDDFTIIFMLRPAELANYNQKMYASGAWGEFVMHTDENGGLYVGTDIATRMEPSNSTYKRGNYAIDVFQRWAYSYSSVEGRGFIYRDDYHSASPVLQTNPNNWSGFMLGENGTGTIHGDITEIFIYDKVLTDAERIHIITYLNTRYVNN